jgi:hypothetical protein
MSTATASAETLATNPYLARLRSALLNHNVAQSNFGKGIFDELEVVGCEVVAGERRAVSSSSGSEGHGLASAASTHFFTLASEASTHFVAERRLTSLALEMSNILERSKEYSLPSKSVASTHFFA